MIGVAVCWRGKTEPNNSSIILSDSPEIIAMCESSCDPRQVGGAKPSPWAIEFINSNKHVSFTI